MDAPLLMKLGAARSRAPTAWRLIAIDVARDSAQFSYRLDRDKLRQTRRREGRYLLRTNLTEHDPAKLWGHYLQLVAVEEAFKNLKGDLAIRPIFHQDEARIEAHIFIAPPTAANCCSSAAPNRSPNWPCYSTSSGSHCRPSRHQKSLLPPSPDQLRCSEDLWVSGLRISTTYRFQCPPIGEVGLGCSGERFISCSPM